MGFRVCRFPAIVKKWKHREVEGLGWSHTAEPYSLLPLSYWKPWSTLGSTLGPLRPGSASTTDRAGLTALGTLLRCSEGDGVGVPGVSVELGSMASCSQSRELSQCSVAGAYHGIHPLLR